MSKQLKTNFTVESKHEAFYTGGKIQFNKTGSQLLCKCSGKVNILDVSSGTIVQSIGQEEECDVSCYTISPDDKVLVLALSNLLLKQWDLEKKDLSRTWKTFHTAPVSCMAFDQTTTLLATGSADFTIKVWDVVQQYCTHNLKGHQGVVTIVQYHPNAEKLHLLSAAMDNSIRVWNLRTSVCVAVMEGHFSVVTGLQFSSDQSRLYSGGRDQVINVWDLKDYSKMRTVPVYETMESIILIENEENPSLNITSKAPHVVTAGSKGILQIWNIHTSQCVYSQKSLTEADTEETKHSDNEAHAIVDLLYCAQSQTIVVVHYDHNIMLYNGKDLSLNKQFAGYNDDILDVKFVGGDDGHLVVATNSRLIKVFEIATWNVQILDGHTDIVLALDVHTSGLMFASGAKDSTVRVWQMNPDSKKVHCVAAAHGHTSEVQSLTFSKVSASLLISGSKDMTLKAWILPSSFSEGEVVRLSARVTEKAHDSDIHSTIISPNDKLVATGSQDKTAKLWQASDLKLLGVFRGHKRGVWSVQFSPVDQCLATASSDTMIKIWALTDFTCVKTFEGHEALVLNVSFLTRGMQLLSSGSDGMLKLWTIKNNECVKTFDEHEGQIWALAVSADETRVITGASDSSIIVWKDVSETEIEEVRQKQEELIIREQEMFNLLQKKKYHKALALAITLEQPFRALNIMKDILGEAGDTKRLQTTLAKLRPDQTDAVLRFSAEWNTNSRHCHVAQCVVSTIIKTLSPEELMELSNAKSAVEGLLPYTEKHFDRMNRLLQQTMFVGYTWQTMKLASDDLSLSDAVAPSGPVPGDEDSASADFDMSDSTPDSVEVESQSESDMEAEDAIPTNDTVTHIMSQRPKEFHNDRVSGNTSSGSDNSGSELEPSVSDAELDDSEDDSVECEDASESCDSDESEDEKEDSDSEDELLSTRLGGDSVDEDDASDSPSEPLVKKLKTKIQKKSNVKTTSKRVSLNDSKHLINNKGKQKKRGNILDTNSTVFSDKENEDKMLLDGNNQGKYVRKSTLTTTTPTSKTVKTKSATRQMTTGSTSRPKTKTKKRK